MALPRLYLAPDMLPAGVRASDDALVLSEMHSHYLRHVLRMKHGMPLLLFNAAAGEWRAELVMEAREAPLKVRLAEPTRPPLAAEGHAPDIWLLCSPLKPARLALALEKATELGVRAVHLVRCAFTQPPPPALPRLQRVMIEAAQQCGRLDVPLLHPPRRLEDLLQSWTPRRLVLWCDELAAAGAADTGDAGTGDAGTTWLDARALAAQTARQWAVLVGPEGGFSETERRFLLRLPHVRRLALSAHILRAETAAAAALAIASFCLRPAAADAPATDMPAPSPS